MEETLDTGLNQEEYNAHEHKVDKGLRFAHLIIDQIVLIVVLTGATTAFYALGMANPYDTGIGWIDIFGWVCIFFYYYIMEATLGTTVGKLITGCVVVDAKGRRTSNAKIAGRSAARFIPFDAFSFLGNRGWHDSLSDTYVVKKQSVPEYVL